MELLKDLKNLEILSNIDALTCFKLTVIFVVASMVFQLVVFVAKSLNLVLPPPLKWILKKLIYICFILAFIAVLGYCYFYFNMQQN